MGTAIEWTDKTWNPTRGCTRVSPGCINCYAERQAHRYSAPGRPYEGLTRITNGRPQWTGEVRCLPEKLGEPLSWRKPCRVFVDSMSDLFHEGVHVSFIEQVFRTMLSAKRHTFQILTKRADRMAEVVPAVYSRIFGGAYPEHVQLPNWIWLGVSVEDQQRADERIPLLLECPAAVRFLSCEPLLAPVDLAAYLGGGYVRIRDGQMSPMRVNHPPLHWVIVGGESGPGARPCELAWVRSLVEQCRAAQVPAFVKQLGKWIGGDHAGFPYKPFRFLLDDRATVFIPPVLPSRYYRPDNAVAFGLTDPKGGDMAEWPEALRVREFPQA